MKKLDEEDIKKILNLYKKHGAAITAKLMHIEYSRCKRIITEAGAWEDKFNKKIYHEFHPDLPKGRKFKLIYLKGYGDGLIKKLAREFNISIATAQRIRNDLELPFVHSKDHPGRKKFYKRVKKLYLKKERSTCQIAKIMHLSSQRINQILVEQGINLREQYVTKCLYYKTKSEMPIGKIIKEIKRMYEDEKMPISHIAKELGIDQGTVSNKLKAMGIEIVSRRYIKEQIVIIPKFNIKGIYLGTSKPYSIIPVPERFIELDMPATFNKNPGGNCVWCGRHIEHLYIAKGPKKQKFCKHRCKNKCKDLRRGPGRSLNRFRKLALEFKGNIGLLGLKPEIKNMVVSIRNEVIV